MKRHVLIAVLCIGIAPFFANSASFEQITKFAENICDRVKTSGSIERTKIMGKLRGEAKTLVKLIGGEIGIDGSITVDNQRYDGIPFNDLPAQITDARACRKELALMLLEREKAIQTIQTSYKASQPQFKVTTNGYDAHIMSQPNFKSFVDIQSNNLKVVRLLEGTKIHVLADRTVEDVHGLSVPWKKVQIASGEHMGRVGWLPEKNIVEM
ncbi:hypothetical protein [Pseudoalteromonas lipolytica]|uniref:hypothetical protein n=1 Tax=Pseudoalteromonas lipolytica TaxID=570156 RepID=UPI00309C0B3A